MPFQLLPPFARAMFSVWTLMIFLLSIFDAAYAVYQKRYHALAVPAGLAGVAELLRQVILDHSLLYIDSGHRAGKMTLALTGLSCWLWMLFLAGMTAAAVFLLLGSIRYGRNRITLGTVKQCADQLPTGICYWRSSGQVILSNHCMNRLCIALTGEPLLNGNAFRGSLPASDLADEMVTLEGKTWRFFCRELLFDGEIIQEMIASDVTEEYRKTEDLKRDTEQIRHLREELQTYRRDMEETIHKQEILQAKINIHDEMNRLMLGTVSVDAADREKLDPMLSMWKKNALLLFMEAENEKRSLENLEAFAGQMNLQLVWKSDFSRYPEREIREIFFLAAREAMVNAVKHAGARTITLSREETKEGLRCIIENDGAMPEKGVHFTGGLRNLSELAQKQGVTLSAEVGDTFRLILIVPYGTMAAEEDTL